MGGCDWPVSYYTSYFSFFSSAPPACTQAPRCCRHISCVETAACVWWGFTAPGLSALTAHKQKVQKAAEGELPGEFIQAQILWFNDIFRVLIPHLIKREQTEPGAQWPLWPSPCCSCDVFYFFIRFLPTVSWTPSPPCTLPRRTINPSSSLHTLFLRLSSVLIYSTNGDKKKKQNSSVLWTARTFSRLNTSSIFFQYIFFLPAFLLDSFFCVFLSKSLYTTLQWKIPPISHTRSVSAPTLFPRGWIPFSLNGPTLYAVAALTVSSLRRLTGQDKDATFVNMLGWLFLSHTHPPPTPPTLPAMQ